MMKPYTITDVWSFASLLKNKVVWVSSPIYNGWAEILPLTESNIQFVAATKRFALKVENYGHEWTCWKRRPYFEETISYADSIKPKAYTPESLMKMTELDPMPVWLITIGRDGWAIPINKREDDDISFRWLNGGQTIGFDICSYGICFTCWDNPLTIP